ncbi:MAG: hypothetical protein EAZ57_01675 [Cytophagales bacterium]|nr:MAG: hypothetical protein EAZ57_01675 [Cytophagales bacterium]
MNIKCNVWAYLAFCFLMLLGCGGATENKHIVDVSKVQAKVTFNRADRIMTQAKSRDEIIDYLKANIRFAERGLRIQQYPSEYILVEELFKVAQSPFVDTICQKIDKVHGANLENVEKSLLDLFKHTKYYFPEFKEPVVYTVVSGYSPGNDLILGDSLAIVGLDFYLGAKHSPYRPRIEDVPQYMWRRFAPNTLPLHFAMQLSTKFAKGDPKDKTLLASMIDWGKTLYFCQKTNPTLPDSVIIGYTAEEWKNISLSQEVVWGYFVEKNLFFDQSRDAKIRFIGERPFTSDISEKCPGRVGAWLGWQIVNAYMENHPETSLKQLMEWSDARKLFEEAKYRPE